MTAFPGVAWLAWLATEPPIGVPMTDAGYTTLRAEMQRVANGSVPRMLVLPDSGGVIDPRKVVTVLPVSVGVRVPGGLQ